MKKVAFLPRTSASRRSGPFICYVLTVLKRSGYIECIWPPLNSSAPLQLRAEAWTAAKSAEAAKLSKKGHKGSISSSICIETNVEEPMPKSEPASATEKDAR